MSKSNHTEAQMIGALKQMEAGRRAEDVAREVGVSKHTLYAWKAKYGGMDVSQAQEAKQLRDENTRLRKLVADLSLDKEALQSVIRKNVWSAAGLQEQDRMKTVCVNVSGLLVGDALAMMSMRAHPAS
jgi:putative transposase